MTNAPLINQCSIILTRTCNLRCQFCFEKDAGYSSKDQFNYHDLKDLIDLCCEANVKYIFLTGGEPLTYPHLLDTLRYIKSKKNAPIVAISSNGLLLKNKGFCKLLAESGLDYIDISMKGKNSEEWQNLTGTDGFETQQEALKNLSLLPIEFTSSMVITPENVHSFCESVRIAYQNGARQFSFTFQIDNEDSQEKNLEYLQKHDPIRLVDNFLMQIDDLSQITNDWWIEYSFPLCVYSKKQLTLLKGHLADPCQIHTNNSITVNTNLDLFHCDMFFSNSIGKFKKDFTTSTELIQFLEKHTYTATLPDFCSECKLLEKCYGGCPVLQKHYSIEALKEFKEVKKKPTL